MTRTRKTIIQDVFDTSEVTKRALFAHFYHSISESGLSPASIRMLFVISHTQPVQPKDLAGKMYLTPGAVTQSIDALVRGDFLQRTMREGDRRSTFISLTDKGEAKVTALKEAQQRRFTEMVSELSDEDLENYLHVQQKILHYLERENKETK